MATITQISAQAKNKSRANIFLDGKFFCGLDVFTVEKFRLKEGMEISEDKLSEIIRESESASLFEKAVALVSARPRSEKEIRQYLKEKGVTEDVSQEIVDKLQRYNFVDDNAFCEYLIRSHKKTWGIKRLKFELRGYGIDEEIISEHLEKMGGQEEEVYLLAQKYLRQKSTVDFNKLFAYLMGKGFSSDDIKSAIATIKDELENEESGNE